MTIEKLKEVHEKRPFQPFRLFMADGSSVEVKHPENLARRENARSIYVFTGPGDRGEHIDLLLVSKIVVGGNGNAHRRPHRA